VGQFIYTGIEYTRGAGTRIHVIGHLPFLQPDLAALEAERPETLLAQNLYHISYPGSRPL